MSGSSRARCVGGGTRTSTYARCTPAGGRAVAAAARRRSDMHPVCVLTHETCNEASVGNHEQSSQHGSTRHMPKRVLLDSG